jgi:PAS domain S-box-containing protein
MIEQQTQENPRQTSKQMEPFISERIRRSEAQLLHHSHDAILINRFNTGRIVFWNRRASELYGWSPQETEGKISHHVLQTKFSEPVQEIKTTLLRNGHWEGELIDRRKDGSPVVVQSRWVLQRRISGAPSDVLQLNQDVTAVKEREEEARQSERLALLGTMAGVFAHEVANPLTGLSFALQFVESALERKEFDAPLKAVVHARCEKSIGWALCSLIFVALRTRV